MKQNEITFRTTQYYLLFESYKKIAFSGGYKAQNQVGVGQERGVGFGRWLRRELRRQIHQVRSGEASHQPIGGRTRARTNRARIRSAGLGFLAGKLRRARDQAESEKQGRVQVHRDGPAQESAQESHLAFRINHL